MKKNIKLILILVLILPYPLYWLTTEAAIRYCVYDITHSEGSTYLFFNSGDETRFLIGMRNRSIKALVNQIEDPNIGLQKKIHLAWILSSIGDHSHFSVFIEGLNSQSSQTYYIAATRMRDFPQECLKQFPDILDAGKKKQHGAYQAMLSSTIDKSSFDKDKKKKLIDILWDDPFDAFSEDKISNLKQLLN